MALRGCFTKAPVYMDCAGESGPDVLVSRFRPKKPPRVMRIATTTSTMPAGMARRRRFGRWICAGEISGGRGNVACWGKAEVYCIWYCCTGSGRVDCVMYVLVKVQGVADAVVLGWVV